MSTCQLHWHSGKFTKSFMLLSIDLYPLILILLLFLPFLNLFNRWRYSFLMTIVFILIRLIPLSSSLITLAPIVLILSLSLWLVTLLKRFHPYNKSHIYYIPSRVPYLLIPLMYILEILSDVVRPVALTVRIVVNLSLRHLFIHLASRVLIGIIIPFIILFELAVAFIQRYIYSSLPSLW